MKSLIESKVVGKIAVIIVILAIAFAIFQAGIFVGFHKASFLFNYGDNYYRNFGGQNFKNGRGMMMGSFRDELSGGHGIVGKIIKIDLPNIVVIGSDNIEKLITISSTTKILSRRDYIQSDKLALDQNIVIIGEPSDSGNIKANFIRITPLMMNSY